jgi:hypothetical protein
MWLENKALEILIWVMFVFICIMELDLEAESIQLAK